MQAHWLSLSQPKATKQKAVKRPGNSPRLPKANIPIKGVIGRFIPNLALQKTPPKTNMEPKKGDLEDYFPSKEVNVSGSMLVFGSVSAFFPTKKWPDFHLFGESVACDLNLLELSPLMPCLQTGLFENPYKCLNLEREKNLKNLTLEHNDLAPWMQS